MGKHKEVKRGLRFNREEAEYITSLLDYEDWVAKHTDDESEKGTMIGTLLKNFRRLCDTITECEREIHEYSLIDKDEEQ